MMRQWLFRSSIISAAVAASIGITACGGGGGGDDTTTTTTTTTPVAVTLSGKVADGYLDGAKVCLDINRNKICDAGEPSAISTAGGIYSLDATQAQIDATPVLVEIVPGTTVDEDSPGTPLTKKYTLQAPAGKGAFVSPLTTMVQNQVEGGKTAEQAESELLSTLGQTGSTISLYDDYVAEKADAGNAADVQADYAKLHQIAQVTAATIANNIELIEQEITSANITLDLTTQLDSLITIIVNQVIAELATISTQIETASTFNADTIATNVDATVDTTTIEGEVALDEALDTVTSATASTFLANGFYWMDAWFDNFNQELERGVVSSSGGLMTESMDEYNFTTQAWVPYTPTLADGDLVLQSNGSWLNVTDTWGGSAVVVNDTAGTISVASPWGQEVISNISEVDIAGQSIKAFVAGDSPELAVAFSPSAVFSAGAKAYALTITYGGDADYGLGIWSDYCSLGDTQYTNVSVPNCNAVVRSGVAISSLASLGEGQAWVDPGDGSTYPTTNYMGCDDINCLKYEMVQGATNAAGTTNYYLQSCIPNQNCTHTKVGTGSWDTRTVNGTSIVYVDHPDALLAQYASVYDEDSPAENDIFAEHEGVVRKGWHSPAGTSEVITVAGGITNQIARNDVTNTPANMISTIQANAVATNLLGCGAKSGWNAFFNQPLVGYNLTEFAAIATACGALPMTAADVMQVYTTSVTYVMNDNTMVTFNADTTGYYTEDGVQQATFGWGVTNNILTITGTGYQDTFALIGVNTTTGNVTFKYHIDEASWGTGTGGDGVADGSAQDGDVGTIGSVYSYGS